MILEDEDDDEIPAGGSAAKKRRLRTDQVRALEQSFDLENRLEPDRKARLAHELGLQPRQVAVWFQNRRARWKAKQLERDFSALKSKYEALRLGFDSLRRDNGALAEQLAALKGKLIAGEEKPRGACESESSAADLFKVEEEDWEEEACGARGLFADEHGSALAWFSAEIAAGGGGGGGW